MRRKVQVVDSKLQQVQTTIGKALTPIIRMMNDIGTGALKNKPIQDYSNQINDALRMGTAAFSYMNQARKEIIRNDLGYSFGQLCSWDYAVPAEYLFSEEVVKLLKEITDTRRQFDDLTNRPYPRYGGGRGGNGGLWQQQQLLLPMARGLSMAATNGETSHPKAWKSTESTKVSIMRYVKLMLHAVILSPQYHRFLPLVHSVK